MGGGTFKVKVLVLLNAGRRSTGLPEGLEEQICQRLREEGIEHKVCIASSATEALRCMHEIDKQGFDTVWVGGGDGSLFSVLNCPLGRNLTYGIIPLGTINALARALEMPLDPMEAVEYLLQAQPCPIDLGKVEDYWFFCYATVGLHAAIFHNVSQPLKHRFGKAAFWISAAKTVWEKSKLPRFTMELTPLAPDGQTMMTPVRESGYSMILSNFTNFAGFGLVLPDDPHGAGYFTLHHFRANRIRPFVKWFSRLKMGFTKKPASSPENTLYRMAACTLQSRRPLSVQADGEPLKLHAPMNLRFECHVGAAKILLKPKVAASLQQPET